MRSTKKSLLMSVLSLMLCVAMLLGTTFAWFTDSVTSGKNTIKAGNLDIEVEYSKDMTSGSWKTVEGTTELFDDVTLWEPGAVSVVYLKIKNAGTLALKYKLGINIASETVGINKEDKEFKLSDYIMFGQDEGVTAAYADRAAAVAAVSGAQKISSGYTTDGEMAAGAADRVIALVVYMPETVGNEANYMTGTDVPTIEMGLNVVATQLQNEADSFGTDYDKDAAIELPVVIPETKVSQHIKVQNGVTTEPVVIKDSADINNAKVVATIPEGAKVEAGTEALELVVTPKDTAPEGAYAAVVDPMLATPIYYDIDVDGLAEDNTVPVEVKLFVGEGYQKANIKVYHKTTEITEFNYTGGYVVFETPTFSPFTLILGDGCYHIKTAQELRTVAKGINDGKYDKQTLVLDNDIDLENVEWTQINGAGHNVTFNGNGKTIKNLKVSDGHNAGFFSTGSGCTIKNLTFDGASVTGVGRIAVICGHGMCVTVDNCTVKNADVAAVVTNNDDGDKAGAVVGYLSAEPVAKVTNCKVENVTVTGYRDIGGLVGYAAGTYTVTGNSLKNVKVFRDASINYKNYTTDAEYDVNQEIGEKTADGTYNRGSLNNVTVGNVHYINNADQLLEFAADVNGGNNYSKDIVKLTADIDLAGIEWTPIGGGGKRFYGIFDGQNHIIKNLTSVLDSTSGTKYGNGLFGDITGGATLKNFTVENANVYDKVDGKGNVYGIVCGYAYGNVTFENITVKNSKVSAFGKVAAILGMAADPGTSVTTIKNCKVEDTEITGAYNCATFAGLTQNVVSLSGNTQSNVTYKYSSRYSADKYTDLNTTAASGDAVNGKYWMYQNDYYMAGWANLYNEINETTINDGAIGIDAIVHN